MKERRNVIAALSAGLDKIMVWLGIFLGASLMVNMVMAVIFRYVFNRPIFWADEVSLFLFAWLTFVGASLSVKRLEMPAVTMLRDRLPKGGQKVVDLMIQLLILFFTLVILYYSYIWVSSPSVMNQLSPTVSLNIWIIYSVIPITMLVTTVFCIDHIVRIVRGTDLKEEEI